MSYNDEYPWVEDIDLDGDIDDEDFLLWDALDYLEEHEELDLDEYEHDTSYFSLLYDEEDEEDKDDEDEDESEYAYDYDPDDEDEEEEFNMDDSESVNVDELSQKIFGCDFETAKKNYEERQKAEPASETLKVNLKEAVESVPKETAPVMPVAPKPSYVQSAPPQESSNWVVPVLVIGMFVFVLVGMLFLYMQGINDQKQRQEKKVTTTTSSTSSKKKSNTNSIVYNTRDKSKTGNAAADQKKRIEKVFSSEYSEDYYSEEESYRAMMQLFSEYAKADQYTMKNDSQEVDTAFMERLWNIEDHSRWTSASYSPQEMSSFLEYGVSSRVEKLGELWLAMENDPDNKDLSGIVTETVANMRGSNYDYINYFIELLYPGVIEQGIPQYIEIVRAEEAPAFRAIYMGRVIDFLSEERWNGKYDSLIPGLTEEQKAADAENVNRVWDEWEKRDGGFSTESSGNSKSGSPGSRNVYNSSNPRDYDDPEEFYYDNWEEFESYDDAESYWEEFN